MPAKTKPPEPMSSGGFYIYFRSKLNSSSKKHTKFLAGSAVENGCKYLVTDLLQLIIQ